MVDLFPEHKSGEYYGKPKTSQIEICESFGSKMICSKVDRSKVKWVNQ